MTKSVFQSTEPTSLYSNISTSYTLQGLHYNNYGNADQTKTTNIEDAITKVQAEIQPDNLGYGLGVLLRNTIQFIPLLFENINRATSLPGAEATKVKKKKLSVHSVDREITTSTGSTFTVRTISDSSRRIDSPEFAHDLQNNNNKISDALEKLIKEGPKTKELIDQCSNLLFESFSPKWSSSIYKSLYNKDILSQAGAGYNPIEGTIYIVHSENLPLMRVIKHECTHYDQRQSKYTYDLSKMDECMDNINNLAKDTVSCFNGKTSPDICEDIIKLSRNYQYRMGEKIVTRDGQVFSPSEMISAVHESIVGERSIYGKDITLSTEQDLMLMGLIILYMRNKEDIVDVYQPEKHKKKQPYMLEKEYEASIKDMTPERVLDRVCPGGFTKKLEEDREKNKEQRSI